MVLCRIDISCVPHCVLRREMSVPKGRWYPGSNQGVQRRKSGRKALAPLQVPTMSARLSGKMGEVSNFYVFSLKNRRVFIDNPEIKIDIIRNG